MENLQVCVDTQKKYPEESPWVEFDLDFESQIAQSGLTLEQVIQKLNCSVYFDLAGIPQPADPRRMIQYLLEDQIVIRKDNGLLDITNLGALLLAKRLREFPTVSRKALRVIQYEGTNRMNMLREETFTAGYAVGFEDVLRYIGALLPAREELDGAVRRTVTAYPALAVRETVVNALTHQDLSITGTGPLIEIFSNRIEVTNPGRLLVDYRRIIDSPPVLRNERLAELMSRMKLCEEAGTGWDKIALSCERMQLPAPRITLYQENVRVTLFPQTAFSSLLTEEKIWTCYLHACVCCVQGEQMTNASLRKRLGLGDTCSSSISRLIKDTVQAGLIRPADSTSKKCRKYVPFWA